MSQLLEVTTGINYCQNCGKIIPPEVALWKCCDQTLCSRQCVDDILILHPIFKRLSTNPKKHSPSLTKLYRSLFTISIVIILYTLYIVWINSRSLCLVSSSP